MLPVLRLRRGARLVPHAQVVVAQPGHPVRHGDRRVPALLVRVRVRVRDRARVRDRVRVGVGVRVGVRVRVRVRVRVGVRVRVRVGVRVGASSRRSSCSAGDPYSYFYTYP